MGQQHVFEALHKFESLFHLLVNQSLVKFNPFLLKTNLEDSESGQQILEHCRKDIVR